MKYIQKYKYILPALLMGGIVAVFSLVLKSEGFIFSIRRGLDMHVQHSFYMEYLRDNLYSSGDLLPDLGMNFGMMQNFAVLYYYGVFNVFVRIFALFPMLNAYQFQAFMNVFVYMFVFYFTSKLLKYLEFDYKYIILGSTMATLSPALTWFFTNHTVFGYPYMLFILSLLGLAKLVKEDKIFLFTFSNIMIITTNLFQLQAAGLFALVFYVFYVLYLGNNKQQIKKSLFKVLISYLLAVGVSAVIIIPQVFLFANESRYSLNEVPLPNIINFRSLDQFISTYFTFGFAFLSAALLCAFALTKKRYIIIPTLMIIAIFEIIDIGYIFNLFALEDKVYLYCSPVIVIIILHVIKELSQMKLRPKIIITLASILLFTIISLNNDFGRDFYFSNNYYMQANFHFTDFGKLYFLIMTGSTFLIYILFVFNWSKNIKNVMFTLLITSYACSSLIYNAIVSPTADATSYRANYAIDRSNGTDISLYRYNDPTSAGEINFDLSKNVIYNYSSFVNPYYHNYFNEIIDLPMSHGGIAFNSFRTSKIIDRVLSVESEETTKPIIYGSYNVIDFNEWMNIERPLRVAASLQGPAVEHNSNANFISTDIMNEIMLVGEYETYDFKGGEKILFDDFNETSGEYIITAKVKTQERVIMYVNGKRNEKTINESRYYNGNDVFTYYIPADGTGLSIDLWTEDVTLDDIKVYHVSEDVMNSYENDYVHPDNFKTDYNDGFSFDITMDQDGILATSIPFDDGYKIYVDGKEVNVELIDGSFIGAELSEGTHQVEIIYTTPGKNMGIVISIGSILVFIYLLKKRGY